MCMQYTSTCNIMHTNTHMHTPDTTHTSHTRAHAHTCAHTSHTRTHTHTHTHTSHTHTQSYPIFCFTANELVGISAPVELRPLLFGVYFTIMGVSMTLGGLIMFIQMKPNSVWCFFCFQKPKTGLMTFIITTMITLVLFLLYLFLSWLYKKLELVIEPRPNEDIHPQFGRHNYAFGPTNED